MANLEIVTKKNNRLKSIKYHILDRCFQYSKDSIYESTPMGFPHTVAESLFSVILPIAHIQDIIDTHIRFSIYRDFLPKT